MKKISLFFLSLVSVSCLFAQQASLGLKGGLNISTLTNSLGGERGSRPGVNAGLLAHVHINQMWAIQPEIVYSSQGAKYTVSDGEHNLALNYVNVPLQVQYMFSNGFRLQTGPQVGFLASVTDKRQGAETGIFTSDDFKSVDFSWSAGLGYMAPSGLGIDGRYNFGLSNINDAGPAVIHNNVFQVGLFYQFNNSSPRR
ncbi:MAG TPA: porin family protein [Flavisolibacter sp.]|nr:porin family protein [Flavisolibacter sp.]